MIFKYLNNNSADEIIISSYHKSMYNQTRWTIFIVSYCKLTHPKYRPTNAVKWIIVNNIPLSKHTCYHSRSAMSFPLMFPIQVVSTLSQSAVIAFAIACPVAWPEKARRKSVCPRNPGSGNNFRRKEEGKENCCTRPRRHSISSSRRCKSTALCHGVSTAAKTNALVEPRGHDSLVKWKHLSSARWKTEKEENRKGEKMVARFHRRGGGAPLKREIKGERKGGGDDNDDSGKEHESSGASKPQARAIW